MPSRWLAVAVAVTALAGCTTAQPTSKPSYYTQRACTDAGLQAGTAEFESCVAQQQARQVQQIYELSIRRSPGLSR